MRKPFNTATESGRLTHKVRRNVRRFKVREGAAR